MTKIIDHMDRYVGVRLSDLRIRFDDSIRLDDSSQRGIELELRRRGAKNMVYLLTADDAVRLAEALFKTANDILNKTCPG